MRQKLALFYLLIGQDPYWLINVAEAIKSAWYLKNPQDNEENLITIDTTADWSLLYEQTNTYSLFATKQLIDIRYEKKTLDTTAKQFITNYLKTPNPDCLLLLRAPNLSRKQVETFVNRSEIQIVQITSLDKIGMQRWIIQQLKENLFTFDEQIPALICQYTQGNMLACAQVIEKLKLIITSGMHLTTEIVKEQLVDQCNYQLFELVDSCLASDGDKALQLLRHAQHNNLEPTLILWILTQEIRQLIQLIALTNQSMTLGEACKKLGIWSQKTHLYQLMVQKISLDNLLSLLQQCNEIDEHIKSNQSLFVWHGLEQITLSLCYSRKRVSNFA